MQKYLLSIDQGTTATKIALYTTDGQLAGLSTKPITHYYPYPGWVEQNPLEILQSIKKGISEIIELSEISLKDILAVAIDNQGETIIAFDKHTGEPIYNAIVWQDRRTAFYCKSINNPTNKKSINDKTGLFIDSYFSATKMRWIIEKIVETNPSLNISDLIISTSDTWLLYKLTGGKSFYTDVTTASRTMLFNINTMRWDDEILQFFKIDKCVLPEVVPSVYDFGICDPTICNGINAPVCVSVVDQQSSLFGHRCFNKGEAKITYGTGGFFLLNIGKERLNLEDEVITTLAAQYNDEVYYVLEGGIYCVGSSINWLVNKLDILSNPESSNETSQSLEDNGGVYFIPGLAGLSCPYWRTDVKGSFWGLTLNTSNKHITRSVLESIAYRFYEIINIIKKNGFCEFKQIHVDGGVSKNNFLIQYQTDLIGMHIERPVSPEITSLGGAYLAGLRMGVWNSVDELKSINRNDDLFKPETDNSEKVKQFHIWKSILSTVLEWSKDHSGEV